MRVRIYFEAPRDTNKFRAETSTFHRPVFGCNEHDSVLDSGTPDVKFEITVNSDSVLHLGTQIFGAKFESGAPKAR